MFPLAILVLYPYPMNYITNQTCFITKILNYNILLIFRFLIYIILIYFIYKKFNNIKFIHKKYISDMYKLLCLTISCCIVPFILNTISSSYGYSRDSIMAMVRILSKQDDGIHICHINAQSLRNKVDEFRLIFENSQIDVICVSVTWLNRNIPDSIVNLSGYKLHRADRKTRGGGVAIFVKSNVSNCLKIKSDEDDAIEYIFVELQSYGRKMLVGCVYRPNRYINTESFISKLNNITESYEELLIAGDFDSNLLQETALSDEMLQIGLVPINCVVPTHFTNTCSTLLDIFFVNFDTNELKYDQLTAPCFSHHDLIYTSYNFPLHHKIEYISYRDFKNIDYDLLESFFFFIDWNSMFYYQSIDDKLNFLQQNILFLYNLIVPIRTKIKKPSNTPWFNTSIKAQIERRDCTYKRWRFFRTSALEKDFQFERRKTNRDIRRAKSQYLSRRFTNALNTKSTWNTIKEIGICNVNKCSTDININVNELNKSFTSLPEVPINLNCLNMNHTTAQNAHSNSTFKFHCVDLMEVLYSMKSIKSNAIGYDNVDPKFVKLLMPQILPYITHLFNSIIISSVFPSQWRHSKIIPVPKSNSEFRPIAILPYLSKVFEKILHKQMSSYLDNCNILNKKQSGFRPKHSCVTALADVSEDIRHATNSGEVTIMILLGAYCVFRFESKKLSNGIFDSKMFSYCVILSKR